MHYIKCKCSSKQEFFKLPCCTTLCGRELTTSVFKMLALVIDNRHEQALIQAEHLQRQLFQCLVT